VAAVLVLNTPDDGRLRPKHVECLCRNKTCTVLHQVGVSFDPTYHSYWHATPQLHSLYKQLQVLQTSHKASTWRPKASEEQNGMAKTILETYRYTGCPSLSAVRDHEVNDSSHSARAGIHNDIEHDTVVFRNRTSRAVSSFVQTRRRCNFAILGRFWTLQWGLTSYQMRRS